MAINTKIKPWYFGNTTVRSPFRLRDGLIAISTSSLQGNLRGVEQDKAFRNLLGDAGIVTLGEDETNSVGRKWRAALSQHGFLFPEIPTNAGIPQSDIGPVDNITPNGWRLIRAETVAGMQECFLRSLAAYYIPNVLDKGYCFTNVFSPLRHTLNIMLELENQTSSSVLGFQEMALIVQFTNSMQSINSIVSEILDFRSRRNVALRKRKFDSVEFAKAAEKYKYVASSFRDYADLNFRYLKATGLFQSKGRGISLLPEKHLFTEKLVADTVIPADNRKLITMMCEGSALPTDDIDNAKVVLKDLVGQLHKRGVSFNLTARNLTEVGDINVVRHEIEDKLFTLNEHDYAQQQVNEWEEIAAWMDLLIANNGGAFTLASGEQIKVPACEAPAYFEWIVWRAFLAIDSLVNPPNDSRKFKIDQDFLPIGTAPGGGPDLIFEFDDFVLVVEVTLTTNSRQEAAEGEPVRRHVANAVLNYESGNKKVYGLFLANKIDSNTAETFRNGVWYRPDDNIMYLDIVPMQLVQFKEFFVSMFQSQKIDKAHVVEIISRCRSLNNHDAPKWKVKIIEEVSSYSAGFSS